MPSVLLCSSYAVIGYRTANHAEGLFRKRQFPGPDRPNAQNIRLQEQLRLLYQTLCCFHTFTLDQTR